MASFARTIVGFVLGSVALVACAEPGFVAADQPVTQPDETDPPGRDDGKTDKNVPVKTSPIEADDKSCAEVCTAGAKRCSATASSGTEICDKGADGCLNWTQGNDCAAGSSCDKDKNDGTCVAGCTNDAGCSATNVGAQTCTSEGSRGRIQCKKVGECFVWTAAASCSPDATCRAGNCVDTPAPACTNECVLNAELCTGSRTRQACVKAATGCTKWAPTTSCSPDETCSAGKCN